MRDRGFIYWRLLSTDPAAAREVVLADKPLISEETDLLEPSLLDELVCHIASLASVYHKPPSAFVEGRGLGSSRRALPTRSASQDILESSPSHGDHRTTVIPSQDSLIGDLLTMDLGGPTVMPSAAAGPFASSGLDLFSGGLDGLLSDTPPTQQHQAPPVASAGLLGDIFGLAPSASSAYVAPKQVLIHIFCLKIPSSVKLDSFYSNRFGCQLLVVKVLKSRVLSLGAMARSKWR